MLRGVVPMLAAPMSDGSGECCCRRWRWRSRALVVVVVVSPSRSAWDGSASHSHCGHHCCCQPCLPCIITAVSRCPSLRCTALHHRRGSAERGGALGLPAAPLPAQRLCGVHDVDGGVDGDPRRAGQAGRAQQRGWPADALCCAEQFMCCAVLCAWRPCRRCVGGREAEEGCVGLCKR